MTTIPRRTALALALLLSAQACGRDTGSPLVGAWRMTSLEVSTEAGALQRVPYSGQIVFTEAGTMSVQAMNPDANAEPTPYTVNGYEAFYGGVVVDDASGTFVVTVESSLVRNLIGQDLERRFEVSGDRLILTPADPQERFRVTYERD
jgi:Lipocalin-like domain